MQRLAAGYGPASSRHAVLPVVSRQTPRTEKITAENTEKKNTEGADVCVAWCDSLDLR